MASAAVTNCLVHSSSSYGIYVSMRDTTPADTELVNCTVEETRIGLPVEFVFRKIHDSGGRPNYFWKGSPLPDA